MRQPQESLPRLLLFGRAGAGKSSLLGALAQVARTQGERLGAEIVDPEASLEPLRERVQANVSPESSASLVIPHRLRLRPWHAGGKEPGEPGLVMIVDSAGAAAEEILKSPGKPGDPKRTSELAFAIEQADALVLAISAGADDAELAASFQAFHEFLESIGTRREWNRSVGGWPVSIVLTQCDRLAQPGDTSELWQQRVEKRKAFVAERFAEFLKAAEDASQHLPFGSLRVKTYASAVRWPRLADASSYSDTPFGVADLFRESLAAARQHHQRVEHSQRRLGWTVRASSAVVAVLVAMLIGLLARHPEAGVAQLEEQIRDFQHREGETSVRLAARNLARNRQTLEAFRDASAFESLPTGLGEYVRVHLHEIEEYESFRKRLLGGPVPADARSLEELERTEERIASSWPSDSDHPWGDTEAGRHRAKWLADIPAIRDGVRAWENWYRDLIREAGALESTATFDGDWRPSVDRFLKRSGLTPFKLNEPLPGSAEVPFPRGDPPTHATPFEFDRVYQARQDWVFNRDRLLDLRDLADALGLTAGPERKSAVLDLPEVETTTLARERLTQLSQQYPTMVQTYPQWSLTRFPEPGRTELSRRLERSFQRGMSHVRARILATMGPMPRMKDDSEGWSQVATRLQDTGFQDWGRLLTLLARLRNAKAEDPVAELAAFLQVKEFELHLDSLEVIVPDDLLTQRAVPKRDLTITHLPRVGEVRTYRFSPVGEGLRSQGETRLHFKGEVPRVLVFRPGDAISASVTLRAGEEELNLTWSDSRCETYAFDALSRPVRGVRLTAGAGTTIPGVPALLPDLRDLR